MHQAPFSPRLLLLAAPLDGKAHSHPLHSYRKPSGIVVANRESSPIYARSVALDPRWIRIPRYSRESARRVDDVNAVVVLLEQLLRSARPLSNRETAFRVLAARVIPLISWSLALHP
jgi:hypothetical protein